jgi:hypothetical protein
VIGTFDADGQGSGMQKLLFGLLLDAPRPLLPAA